MGQDMVEQVSWLKKSELNQSHQYFELTSYHDAENANKKDLD